MEIKKAVKAEEKTGDDASKLDEEGREEVEEDDRSKGRGDAELGSQEDGDTEGDEAEEAEKVCSHVG